jgi:His-Xaa-Ser system radical SAM maturase HxsC
MRMITAEVDPRACRRAHQVAYLDQLPAAWTPGLHYAIPVADEAGKLQVEALNQRGLANVIWIATDELEAGDVIVPEHGATKVHVSYRASDRHHTLFVTNRCNSYCLMCSQPPTKQEDGWLVDEALDIVRHIEHSPRVIGITGGEPLLLGHRLRELLDAIVQRHPDTVVELLSNGRLLRGADLAHQLLDRLQTKVRWLIPLYGHAAALHDFVVQSPGAFEETLAGILSLQRHGQSIQLRIVLIEPVLEHLELHCEFIGRNLPFVSEVALMSCEPIGFALANRELCEVDLAGWSDVLSRAARNLERHRVPYIFMNAPLCALPSHLRPRARRSISDWKQVYGPECDQCSERKKCSGLFAWHVRGWKPTKITPILESLP